MILWETKNGGIDFMDTSSADRIREHLADELSDILFEGRLAYLETKDAEVMGQALSDYFTEAPEQVKNDSPELFKLVTDAKKEGFIPELTSLLSEDARNFYFGLDGNPEYFTDIYGCYFDSGIFRPGKNEVFIDGGAQDLFTSFRFSKITGGRYKAILAFEPDVSNFVECWNNRENFDERLFLSKTALSDGPGTAMFSEKRENSCFDMNGKYTVVTDTLDNLVKGVRPTFLKLHLEGAEYLALSGAEKTVRQYDPLIAVAVDHNKKDILSIPELLLSWNRDYTFWLRHYSSSITETVLYAKVKN